MAFKFDLKMAMNCVEEHTQRPSQEVVYLKFQLKSKIAQGKLAFPVGERRGPDMPSAGHLGLVLRGTWGAYKHLFRTIFVNALL